MTLPAGMTLPLTWTWTFDLSVICITFVVREWKLGLVSQQKLRPWVGPMLNLLTHMVFAYMVSNLCPVSFIFQPHYTSYPQCWPSHLTDPWVDGGPVKLCAWYSNRWHLLLLLWMPSAFTVYSASRVLPDICLIARVSPLVEVIEQVCHVMLCLRHSALLLISCFYMFARWDVWCSFVCLLHRFLFKWIFLSVTTFKITSLSSVLSIYSQTRSDLVNKSPSHSSLFLTTSYSAKVIFLFWIGNLS